VKHVKVFVVFAVLVLAVPALAAVYYVDSDIGAPGSGASWASALPTIQQGIDSASSGDDVYVKGGGSDYVENLTLKGGVRIFGSFAGTETSYTERDVATTDPMNWTSPSVLDGGAASWCFQANGLSNTRVDGLVITNGREANGAALWYLSCDDTNVLANCWITENHGTLLGGGGYFQYSATAVDNCWFTSNSSVHGGGPQIDNVDAWVPWWTRCRFMFNNATGYDGGGIRIYYAGSQYYRFVNCLFYKNQCGRMGGAIYTYTDDPFVTNCTIVENWSRSGSASYQSACMARAGCYWKIANCIFYRNLRGGYYNYQGRTPTYMHSCCFWENYTDDSKTTFGQVSVNAGTTWWNTGAEIDANCNGSGNIVADPLFADVANMDFNITFPSPCRDAGFMGDAPLVDITGLNRTGIADIGCYEWGAGLYSAEDWVLY
jgi:hypothetical protein